MNQPAADEPPVLTIDPAQREAWIRQAMVISQMLQELQRRAGRRAWSDAEAAALGHDTLELAAQPLRMAPLDEADWQQWATQDPQQVEQHEVVSPDHGEGRRVRVGPLSDGRWVVDAGVYAVGPDGALTDEQRYRCVIGCDSEQTARELADGMLATENLEQLAGDIAAQAARHAEAVRLVREHPAARARRIEAAIREHWHPELVAKVLYDPYGRCDRDGNPLPNEAFEALATRLHQLEEEGISLATALGRVSQDDLLGPNVRNPAALAEWMFENMLTVIDGDPGSPEPERHQGSPTTAPRRPSPTPRPSAQAPAPPAAAARPPQASVDREWTRALAEDTVWPALRDALPADLRAELQGSRGYDRLIDLLVAKHSAGWSLDALLTNMPIDRIRAAEHPAHYMRGVVERRARQSGPAKTGVDRAAMARMVREAYPAGLAKKITEECPAWPKLASQMAHVGATFGQGDPSVVELLRGLPIGAIARARKPAAYAADLLAKSVAARRGEPAPEAADQIAPDRAMPAAVSAFAVVSGSGLAEVAAHQHAADHAIRLAAAQETAAAAERTVTGKVPDETDPDIEKHPERAEDHAGETRVDDNLAAANLAEAAEQKDAAAAAALRARVVLTPSSNAPTEPKPQVQRTTPVVKRQPPLRELTRPIDRKRGSQR